MTRRRKPMSPELIAQQAAEKRAAERAAAKDPAQWGVNLPALKAQPDVEVVMHRSKRGVAQTARRDDVFDRLHARGGLSEAAFLAVRRLDADMTERRGEGERGEAPKVDSQGSREIVTQRMLDAGRRVDAVMSMVGLRDRALIGELLEPKQVLVESVLEANEEGKLIRREVTERWRQVVLIMTGERHVNAQAASIRAACENLTAAFCDIDHRPRNAA